MKDYLLKLNLQFFAEDGEGAEVSEAAEPTETNDGAEASVDSTEVDGADNQEVTEPEVDTNKIAAAARREAESRIKAMDNEFVRRFGNLKNPVTGKAITNAQEYLDALDAQENIKRNRELRDKGIDPKLIDKMIEDNPIVRQAQTVIEQNNQLQIQKQLDEEVKQISLLDPNIKTFADLGNNPYIEQIQEKVAKGYSLYDAYVLSNYADIMQKQKGAAEQKAINQAKGKTHLTPTTSGASTNDGMKDIPNGELDKWKAFFPDASMKELKEKYNRAKRN